MSDTYYPLGTTVELRVTFQDRARKNRDPSVVQLLVKPRGGITTTFTFGVSPGFVRDGVGRYHLDYLPPAAGEYEYRGTGTGDVVAQAGQTFYVEASNV